MKRIIKHLPSIIITGTFMFVIASANGQTTKDTVHIKKEAHPGDVINPGVPQNANVVLSDTGFINKNIADNIMEVQLSKLGRDKGSGAQIKKIASLMLSDHTAILNELRRLATAKIGGSTEGHMPGMSTAPAMPELTVEPGKDFNTTWASHMLTMHEAKIRELEEFMAITQDVAIKEVAGRALPKIRMHRDMLAAIPGAKAGPGPNTVIQ